MSTPFSLSQSLQFIEYIYYSSFLALNLGPDNPRFRRLSLLQTWLGETHGQRSRNFTPVTVDDNESIRGRSGDFKSNLYVG